MLEGSHGWLWTAIVIAHARAGKLWLGRQRLEEWVQVGVCSLGEALGRIKWDERAQSGPKVPFR